MTSSNSSRLTSRSYVNSLTNPSSSNQTPRLACNQPTNISNSSLSTCSSSSAILRSRQLSFLNNQRSSYPASLAYLDLVYLPVNLSSLCLSLLFITRLHQHHQSASQSSSCVTGIHSSSSAVLRSRQLSILNNQRSSYSPSLAYLDLVYLPVNLSSLCLSLLFIIRLVVALTAQQFASTSIFLYVSSLLPSTQQPVSTKLFSYHDLPYTIYHSHLLPVLAACQNQFTSRQTPHSFVRSTASSDDNCKLLVSPPTFKQSSLLKNQTGAANTTITWIHVGPVFIQLIIHPCICRQSLTQAAITTTHQRRRNVNVAK